MMTYGENIVFITGFLGGMFVMCIYQFTHLQILKIKKELKGRIE